MAQEENFENTWTFNIIINGTGGALGAVQGILSKAFQENPSIATGIALGKVTVFNLGTECIGVTIALQSGNPDRIGSTTTQAMGSIIGGTIGSLFADSSLLTRVGLTAGGIALATRNLR